jgi:hypothetical protein
VLEHGGAILVGMLVEYDRERLARQQARQLRLAVHHDGRSTDNGGTYFGPNLIILL